MENSHKSSHLEKADELALPVLQKNGTSIPNTDLENKKAEKGNFVLPPVEMKSSKKSNVTSSFFAQEYLVESNITNCVGDVVRDVEDMTQNTATENDQRHERKSPTPGPLPTSGPLPKITSISRETLTMSPSVLKRLRMIGVKQKDLAIFVEWQMSNVSKEDDNDNHENELKDMKEIDSDFEYREFASLFPKIRQFDASRGLKRAVTKFSHPLASQPFTICLHTANADDETNHSTLRRVVYSTLKHFQNFGINTIQFCARNVILGTRGVENRWLITLTSREAAEELVRLGVVLSGKRVQLCFYDDVQRQDYKEYQDFKRYEVHRKRLFEQIIGKRTPGVGQSVKKRMKKRKGGKSK